MPVSDKYKTATMKRETYQKLQDIAKDQDKSVSKVIEEMVEEHDRSALLLGIFGLGGSVSSNPNAWREHAILREILKDKRIKFYKSASWVRSEEYPEKVDPPLQLPDRSYPDMAHSKQWPDTLEERIARDPEFRFEKLLIISQEALEEKSSASVFKKRVMDWACGWYLREERYPEKVEVVAVEQKDADALLGINREATESERAQADAKRKFYDMGLYKPVGLGFLSIDPKSEPGSFEFKTDTLSLKQADDIFDKLKKHKHAMSMSMSMSFRKRSGED